MWWPTQWSQRHRILSCDKLNWDVHSCRVRASTFQPQFPTWWLNMFGSLCHQSVSSDRVHWWWCFGMKCYWIIKSELGTDPCVTKAEWKKRVLLHESNKHLLCSERKYRSTAELLICSHFYLLLLKGTAKERKITHASYLSNLMWKRSKHSGSSH